MSGERRYHERQRCPECRRFVATLVPWHGDGSLVRFVAHGPVATRCRGSREVPPGYPGTAWPGAVTDIEPDTL